MAGPGAPAHPAEGPGGSELPPLCFWLKTAASGEGHRRRVLLHLLGVPSAARPTWLPAPSVKP